MFSTGTNLTAPGAGFGRVSRINQDHGNARLLRLVFDFGSKVVEGPSAKHLAHRLTFRGSFSDAAQVFKCNGAVGFFCILNNPFRDNVIDIGYT